MAPDPLDEQVAAVVAAVSDVIGPVIAGAHLYGSAVAGGLRPDSDLDLFVVTSRRTTRSERSALVERVRPLSDRRTRPPGWRPVELTVVVRDEVAPWRYPPRMDFQYGEWLRDDLLAGRVDPWPPTNPDLAVLITMVRLRSRTVLGRRAEQLLDAVPRDDLVRAMIAELDPLLDDLETDTRNVLLTLARMWSTVADGVVRSKDEAADWAIARLPDAYRPVLAQARDAYLRGTDESCDEGAVADGVQSAARHLAVEIRRRAGT